MPMGRFSGRFFKELKDFEPLLLESSFKRHCGGMSESNPQKVESGAKRLSVDEGQMTASVKQVKKKTTSNGRYHEMVG